MDLVELYVIIDDFCKAFMPRYLKILKNKKQITGLELECFQPVR